MKTKSRRRAMSRAEFVEMVALLVSALRRAQDALERHGDCPCQVCYDDKEIIEQALSPFTKENTNA